MTMKLFDKYFQPYAEYCLRTTLKNLSTGSILHLEFQEYYEFRGAISFHGIHRIHSRIGEFIKI